MAPKNDKKANENKKMRENFRKIIGESIKEGSKDSLGRFSEKCLKVYEEKKPIAKRLKEEKAAAIKAVEDAAKAAGKEKADQGDLQIVITRENKKMDNAMDVNSPFEKFSDLAYQLAVKMSEKNKAHWTMDDYCKAMDEVDAPIEDKINFLNFVSEYTRENYYVSAMNGKGADLDTCLNRMDAFQRKYGVGARKKVTLEKGGVQKTTDTVDTDLLAHKYGEMCGFVCNTFAQNTKRYEHYDQAKGRRMDALEMEDFCKRKLEDYHYRMISGDLGDQKSSGNDPYFQSEKFREIQKPFLQHKEMLEVASNIIGSEDNKKGSLTEKLSAAKLFGRGSKKFDEMAGAYKNFNNFMKECKKKPDAFNMQRLIDQKELLKQKTDEYLDYKKGQIKNGKISGVVIPEGNGGYKYIMENENTQKRMDFAVDLKAEMEKFDAFIEKYQPQTEAEVNHYEENTIKDKSLDDSNEFELQGL